MRGDQVPLTEHGHLITDMEMWRDRALAAEDELAALHTGLAALRRATVESTGINNALAARWDALLKLVEAQ